MDKLFIAPISSKWIAGESIIVIPFLIFSSKSIFLRMCTEPILKSSSVINSVTFDLGYAEILKRDEYQTNYMNGDVKSSSAKLSIAHFFKKIFENGYQPFFMQRHPLYSFYGVIYLLLF